MHSINATARIAVASLLLTVLVAPGCTKPTPVAPPPSALPVTVAHPIAMPIVEWDRYTGRLSAVQSVEVRSRVTGHLHSIHFTEGDTVEKDALLFIIDPRPFENAVASARAKVSEANARLVHSNAQLSQANAETARSEAMKVLAQSRLDRAKEAVTTNSIAREQVDVRESELAQAAAALDAARAAVLSANADVATSTAGIATAEVAVERAELDLSYTRVRAPIRGRIGRRVVTPGNLIDGGTAGATLLTTIVSLDPIYCDVDCNEAEYLKYVRLAQQGRRKSARDVKHPIFLALVDEKNYPHQGYIDFVDNRIDPNTGTLRGRAVLANADGVLTPGMFATVRLPGSERYDALLLPDAAVLHDQSKRIALVLDDKDVIQPRPVQIGPIVRGLRVVRSGLEAKDRVVVGGLHLARPGLPTMPTMQTIEPGPAEDDLPDSYSPVPKEQWINVQPDPIPAEEPARSDKK